MTNHRPTPEEEPGGLWRVFWRWFALGWLAGFLYQFIRAPLQVTCGCGCLLLVLVFTVIFLLIALWSAQPVLFSLALLGIAAFSIWRRRT
jgi:CHASE2 domain-containing sensor protein